MSDKTAAWAAYKAAMELETKRLPPNMQTLLSEARMRLRQVTAMYGKTGVLALMIEGAEEIGRQQSKTGG